VTGVQTCALPISSWAVGAHVEHVPDYSDGFLYGRTIGWWTRISKQEPYNLSLEVMNQYNRGNKTGIANSCYLGDAWANFGWAGAFGYAFFVGVWLAFLDRCLLRLRPTACSVALWALLSVEAMLLSHTAFQVYLVSFGSLPLGIVVWYLGVTNKATINQPALA